MIGESLIFTTYVIIPTQMAMIQTYSKFIEVQLPYDILNFKYCGMKAEQTIEATLNDRLTA